MANTIAAGSSTSVTSETEDLRQYEIVALEVPIAYNKLGDHDHSGLMFALRRNYDHLTQLNVRDHLGKLVNFSTNPTETDQLVRPLVLRACKGEVLEVTLLNYVQGRRVGLHLIGGGYDVEQHDGARVGGNADSTVGPYSGSGAAPSHVYRWDCDHEGVFVIHDASDFGGTKDSSNLHGLFGVLVVEPEGTTWRDSSGQDPRWSDDPDGDDKDNQIDGLYVDVVPRSRREVPEEARTPWLSAPRKYPLASHHGNPPAFREFVIVIHDEPEVDNHSDLTKVLPPWGDEPNPHAQHGIHTGVSHVMPISYRAEPMRNRERIIWSRLTGTPVKAGDPKPEPLQVPVVNEEQHHSSWMFGDPETPVLRAYMGDPIRIRLVHCGVKESHVYHLHLYAWHPDPANHESPLIDAITISPQTGHTIEPLYGAGNRQLTPGDVIWHCHLYPHFHHGMWGLFRTYDRLHQVGTNR